VFDIDLDRFKNIALIENDTKIDYKSLEKRVETFSKQLPSTKQLIAFCIEPTIQNIVAYLSFLRKNYAILMIDSSIDDDLKQNLYKKYNPNFIYKDEKLIPYNNKKLQMYEKLSLLLPTSGSTGSSKYVRLTKENLYVNANSICGYLPITKEDR